MKLTVSDSVDRNQWDATVASFGGTIFHMSIWADYQKNRQTSLIPQYFNLLRDDGSVAGCALSFKESSRIWLMKPFTKHLWSDSFPLVDSYNSDEMDIFLAMQNDHVRKNGYVKFSIGSFASKNDNNKMKYLGFDIKKRFEFLIQIDAKEDTIWKNLSTRRKRSIKSAYKHNVTFELLDDKQGLKELRRLQIDSSKRILKRGGPDLNIQQSNLKDPINVLQQAGVAKIFGARFDGNIVSAAMILYSNRKAYYMQAGHCQKGLETNAPSLLIWECLQLYKKKGADIFNLGGCSADAVAENSSEYGLYIFKKEFGGKIVECSSGQIIIGNMRSKLGNQLHAFRKYIFQK